MNWKNYEQEILAYFQESYPDARISFDQKIVGRFSKVERQIDVLIEGDVAGYEIRIVVDCKYFAINIDVKQVESFCSMVEDIDAHQGVLITNKGYSQGAINRAFYGNNKVELDIINFDELKNLQSFTAIPYTSHFAVIIPAPFGWVLDLEDKINSFASLHQRGLSLRDAQKKREWMYMEFWKLENPEFTIDQLIEIQNTRILEVYPKAIFTYNSVVKRKDGFESKIRMADIDTYPAIEVTGFVHFKEYIFFIVLFTPKELLTKNLRKLQYLINAATSAEVAFDNHSVIQEMLTTISLTSDNEIQANGYYLIGIWYQEMKDLENAMLNFRKSIQCFPTHYSNLKGIIDKTLYFGYFQESKQFAVQLFKIEPTNPISLQDLLEIYLSRNKSDVLIEIFNDLIAQHNDLEVLGNLNFHLGLLFLEIEDKDKAKKHMEISNQNFIKVLPPEHQVFKSLLEFNEIINTA